MHDVNTDIHSDALRLVHLNSWLLEQDMKITKLVIAFHPV